MYVGAALILNDKPFHNLGAVTANDWSPLSFNLDLRTERNNRSEDLVSIDYCLCGDSEYGRHMHAWVSSGFSSILPSSKTSQQEALSNKLLLGINECVNKSVCGD